MWHWLVLGVIGWALGMVLLLLLLRMASYQDRAARHHEKYLYPHSDVTITQLRLG